jgi:hypothetical protein
MESRRSNGVAAAMVACWLSTWSVAQAQDVLGVHFAAAVNDYYGVEYVTRAKPPALEVVYAGEPFELRLSFGNRNSAAESLATNSLSIERAFDVSVLRMPDLASRPVLVPRAIGHIRTAQSTSDIEWSDNVVIPPRGEVTFSASIITTPSTPPGVYELKITPNVVGTAKINLLGPIVRYEVRAVSTFADQVEMLRRHMMREYYHDNAAAAGAAADALLQQYPTGASAYRIKGQLASSAGRTTEAFDALGKARELLAGGQDVLWQGQHDRSETQHAIYELTQQIDAMKKRAPGQVH